MTSWNSIPYIQSCHRYMSFSRMMPFNYDPATAYTIMAWSVATPHEKSILLWEALMYD